MKKISLIVVLFLIVFNLHAEEQIQNQMRNADKLDVLDKQSKEFFNAITGLEKDYLEEQVSAIKNKKEVNPNGQIINSQMQVGLKEEPKLSQEDYEKYVFTHQNDMARLTTDFTRTKKLKDLKIKSMYSFNGKDYVVLKLEDELSKSTENAKDKELSANIEGRYVEGDSILGHKIVDINTRTKSIELYKKLDEANGYTIYLSNYGISVSDLIKAEKVDKKETSKSGKKDEIKPVAKEESPINKVFEQVSTKEQPLEHAEKVSKKNTTGCLYTVMIPNLNVRNSTNLNGKILRILRNNDHFSIKQKENNWIQIDTIYKNKSGDVMDVSDENNWIQVIDNNVSIDKNCM